LNDVVQAVVFDLDDTLVVEEPAAVAAFMEVCRQAEQHCGVEADKLYAIVRETARSFWRQSPARPYCIEIGISSWEGLWAEFEGDDPTLRVLREWAPHYRVESWRAALMKCGVSNINLATELADAFRKNRRKHQVLYDDTIYCLDEFSKLFPLALLTNGVPDLQREKIEVTGIAKYFTEIVISGEVGYGKSDRRIYQLVLSRLGTKPESTWNIGDSLERDILAAKATGIKTVWVNRHGMSRDESIVPDLEVSNLAQLVTTVRRLTRNPNRVL
jgi:putative hydrolase of the HAD superfamily